MEKENKELLLKDLCARLPYGVKVWYKYETWHCEMFATSIRLTNGKIALSSKFNKEGDWYPIEEAGEILIKPYLRPMSSMTEEEKKEYQAFFNYDGVEYPEAYIDWLNKKMFDYRKDDGGKTMIEKGLALQAPKGMYNINKKEK